MWSQENESLKSKEQLKSTYHYWFLTRIGRVSDNAVSWNNEKGSFANGARVFVHEVGWQDIGTGREKGDNEREEKLLILAFWLQVLNNNWRKEQDIESYQKKANTNEESACKLSALLLNIEGFECVEAIKGPRKKGWRDVNLKYFLPT